MHKTRLGSSVSAQARPRMRKVIAVVSALALVIALLALGICALRGNFARVGDSQIADNEPLDIALGGDVVTAGEFRYALNEVKSDVVAACAHDSESIGADFWNHNSATCDKNKTNSSRSETERDESILNSAYSQGTKQLCTQVEHPVEFATCEAIRLLERQHAAYKQAVDGGQMIDGTWEEVIASFNATNAENSSAKQSGETVYGIEAYDLPVYVSLYITQLKDAYILTDAAPGMDVTDEQVRAHFEAEEWDFGPDYPHDRNDYLRDLELWKRVAPSVEADLRTKIYYSMLAHQVEAMDSQISRAATVKFVQDYYAR